jgi:hypothetical protein
MSTVVELVKRNFELGEVIMGQTKTIERLRAENDRQRGCNCSPETWEENKKLKQLLKTAFSYIKYADDCELSIGEHTINTEKWLNDAKGVLE